MSSTSETIKVTLDDRERGLISILKERTNSIFKGVEWEIKNLPIGDIIIQKEGYILVIERKTTCDMVQSIKDGRYREQKQRLIHEKTHGKTTDIMYILEHKNTSSKDTDLCRTTVLSILLRDNIKVFHTSSIEDTFSLILTITEKLNRNKFYKELTVKNSPDDGSTSPDSIFTRKAKKSANMTVENCYISQLAQIPGVSEKIARVIACNYSSLMSFLLDATEEDICNLKVGNRKLGKKGSLIFKYMTYDPDGEKQEETPE